MEHKYNAALIPNAKSLRRDMTKEERHLWYDFLRRYPIKFRRQAVMRQYIADFYCPEVQLVIELDGSQHGTKEAREYDRIRTEFLEQYGLTVMRIPNTMIHRAFLEVCEYIDHYVRRAMGEEI